MSNRQYNTYQECMAAHEIACPACGGGTILATEKVTIMHRVALEWSWYKSGDEEIYEPCLSTHEECDRDYHWKNGTRYQCADCGKSSVSEDTFIRPVRRS